MTDPLKVVGIFPFAIFLLFIGFFNFVILNIINSVFLESMINHSQHDNQLIIDQMMEQKQDYIDKLQLVYDVIDDDGDGEISYDEFCRHTESPELQAFASSMDIDVSD